MSSGVLIRNAREQAGITQAQLARRMNTSQPAIARLEADQVSPRLATLDRAMRVMGYELTVEAVGPESSIDPTLIAANLKLTPAERLRAHARAQRSFQRLRQLTVDDPV